MGAVDVVRVECAENGILAVSVDGVPLPSWLGKCWFANMTFEDLTDRTHRVDPAHLRMVVVTLTCENGELKIRTKRMIEYLPSLDCERR